METRKKSNYTVSRDSRSGAWYAHMKGFPYIPIEGSISGRRADAAEYAKLYNGQKNRVEEIERKRKEERDRWMNSEERP